MPEPGAGPTHCIYETSTETKPHMRDTAQTQHQAVHCPKALLSKKSQAVQGRQCTGRTTDLRAHCNWRGTEMTAS